MDDYRRQLYNIRYDCLDRAKAYLEQMAREGWMFAEYTGYYLIFRKCEPRQLNFAVEVFEKSSEFDTFCNEENLEYIEYCEKAGWKHITSCGILQFFYSENMELTPIETDDSRKLATIWKKLKATRLMADIGLLLIGVLNLYLYLGTRPIETLKSFSLTSLMLVWLAVIIGNLAALSGMVAWKKKCEKSIARGEGFLFRKGMSAKTETVILCVVLGIWSLSGILARILLHDSPGYLISGVSVFALALLYARMGLQSVLREKRVSRTKNLVISVAVPTVITLVFCFVFGILCAVFWKIPNAGLLFYAEERSGEAVLVRSREEFYKNNENSDVTALGQEDRFLLTYREGEQFLWNNEQEQPGVRMHYRYYATGLPGVLEFILNAEKKGKHLSSGLMYDFARAGAPETKAFADGSMQVYLNQKENSGWYDYVFVGKNGLLRLYINCPLAEESYEMIYEKVK